MKILIIEDDKILSDTIKQCINKTKKKSMIQSKPMMGMKDMKRQKEIFLMLLY